MSPEAQRIAIAEACGWTHILRDPLYLRGKNPTEKYGLEVVPNYLYDLNAMHFAEKTLTNSDDATGSRWCFIQELIEVTKAESMEIHREVFVVAHATAAQRAEAFLKTIGKWTP